MAGRRTAIPISTQSSLDFQLESKIWHVSLTSSEVLLAIGTLFVASGLTVTLLWPFIRYWGIISILIYIICIPTIIARLKKNKPHSWLFDYRHRIRLMPLNTRGHWVRPRSTQIYTGHRRLARSAWTLPKRATLIPTRPEHLTLGLPRVALYKPQTKTMGKSITPQFRGDGYSIMSRRFLPSSRRIPEYFRNCVISRDQHGKAAMQDYSPVITRWNQGARP